MLRAGGRPTIHVVVFRLKPVPLVTPINPAVIEHARARRQSVENRVADRITAFRGSMRFVYLHILWFTSWIAFVAQGIGNLLHADVAVIRTNEGDGTDITLGSWSADPGGEPVEQRSSISAPIVVAGGVCIVMRLASQRPQAFPEGAENGLAPFTELVAVAIADTRSRAGLAASRRRIVAAADEVRRRSSPKG